MLKKILFVVIAGCLAIQCNNLKPEDSNRGTTAGLDNNFLLTYGFFFIAPNLDFNQFCPPTDQIPILEPGTYTRFMQAGDTYLFDNRGRFQQSAPAGEERIFTFVVQESIGQDIKLTTPECGTDPFEYRASNDSGLSGQVETVYIRLRTPPLPIKRSNFFTKLTVISGSGNISFTTPSAPDPKNAH